ncbi:DUF6474 family protein [Nakamurella deserti]|uniref:DUF6474 family protein n=1 Tax=Nakamurella deserti TaxID=2164074 RepID=UPI000DBE6712|nr:DUF6474 family protein [Nakamurella deserti]
MVGNNAALRLGAAALDKVAGRKPSRATRLASSVARTLGDPKKTKRLMSVGQVVAPMLAPVALKAVDNVRLLADQQRAKKLGVPVDDVALYRGPTGPVRARLDAVAAAVRELKERRGGDATVTDFADRTMTTLTDLGIAVNAAAPMPAARRKPTVAAVERELDKLERDLITHLLHSHD